MKELNRREFLKRGLLAAGAFFVATSPLLGRGMEKAFAADSDSTVERLLAEAKEHFYQKSYEQAAQCYRSIIRQQPDTIVGYDGLARVFRAQNRLLEAAEAYREGWIERPASPVFTDRLATSMRRLAAGNRKQEKIFCDRYGRDVLYETAAQLYLDVIEQQKDAPMYLFFGVLDVQKAVELHNKGNGHKVVEVVSLSSATIKRISQIDEKTQYKWSILRENRNKRAYDVQSEEELNRRKAKSEAKVRRKLHFREETESRERELVKGKKGLYYPLFSKALQEKSTEKVENYHEGIIAADSTDSNATGQIIRHYRRQKEYEKLVQFQERRYKNNPKDLWITVSYAQALRLQAKEKNIPSLYNTAYELYKRLGESEQLGAQEKLAIYGGELDCLFRQGKYEETKNAVIRVMKPYPFPILPYLLVYIKCLIEERKYREANEAFQLLLYGEESELLAADPIYPYLQRAYLLIKLPSIKKSAVEGYGLNKEELFNIYYAMINLYEKNGDGGAKRQLLNTILEIDPNNRFAQKRI